MKYCRACKRKGSDALDHCVHCGQKLVEFGKPSDDGKSVNEPMLALQGEIQKLETQVQQIQSQSRLLALASIAFGAGILAILYSVYASAVLAYAILDNVAIRQDDRQENLLHIEFDVVEPGKVSFDHRSGPARTEKIDVFRNRGRHSLTWGWPADPTKGVDFRVVYRAGWFTATENRHFTLTGERPSVDVIFLIDTTGSMEPYIQGVQRKCHAFADQIRDAGVNCRLGLVGFGDVERGEPIFSANPTDDVTKFQSLVGQIPRTQGGDIPESSVEALRTALAMSFRPKASICFVHVTDASCHHPEELPIVAREMQSRGIVTFILSDGDNQNLYSPLCVNGGRFFGIRFANFDEILSQVAVTLSNQIRYR